jgi:hypothetical protein
MRQAIPVRAEVRSVGELWNGYSRITPENVRR